MFHDFPVDVSENRPFLLKLLAVVLETGNVRVGQIFDGGLRQYLIYAVEEFREVRLVAVAGEAQFLEFIHVFS